MSALGQLKQQQQAKAEGDLRALLKQLAVGPATLWTEVGGAHTHTTMVHGVDCALTWGVDRQGGDCAR